MKLSVFTPLNPEARYLSEHLLAPAANTGGCVKSVAFFGAVIPGVESAGNPLTFPPAGAESFPVHHLVDDRSVRVERVLLGAAPGITIAHDVFLTDHGPEPTLNSGFTDTVDMVRALASGKREVHFPERGKEYEREKYFAIRELSLSLFPIFTDPVARAEYQRRNVHGLAVGDAYVPWPVPDSVFERGAARWPAERGPMRVGISGGVRLGSRVWRVFEAINSQSKLCEGIVVVWLLRDAGELAAAKRLCAEFPAVMVELRIGRTPAQWIALCETLDCAAHLHFGMFERPGPYLPLSLAAGLPCLCSTEAQLYLPAGSAFFVRPGDTEVGEIAAVFAEILGIWRAGDRGSSSGIDTGIAVEYARTHHCGTRVVAEFLELLSQHEGALVERARVVAALGAQARRDLLTEISSPQELTPMFQELGWTIPEQSTRGGV
jgi:hypothetical protein